MALRETIDQLEEIDLLRQPSCSNELAVIFRKCIHWEVREKIAVLFGNPIFVDNQTVLDAILSAIEKEPNRTVKLEAISSLKKLVEKSVLSEEQKSRLTVRLNEETDPSVIPLLQQLVNQLQN